MQVSQHFCLLPLNRPRRFGSDVIQDTVDSRYLVADAVGAPCKHLGRETEPVGRHGVLAGHGTQRADLAISAVIPQAKTRTASLS